MPQSRFLSLLTVVAVALVAIGAVGVIGPSRAEADTAYTAASRYAVHPDAGLLVPTTDGWAVLTPLVRAGIVEIDTRFSIPREPLQIPADGYLALPGMNGLLHYVLPDGTVRETDLSSRNMQF
ncbi:MAG: hypothetical protein AAGI30_08695 [Planctomycetota bacterium]